MTALFGFIFGYVATMLIDGLGVQRGWSTRRKFALLVASILVFALPIVWLAKWAEQL